jgi:hypothetical protein
MFSLISFHVCTYIKNWYDKYLVKKSLTFVFDFDIIEYSHNMNHPGVDYSNMTDHQIIRRAMIEDDYHTFFRLLETYDVNNYEEDVNFKTYDEVTWPLLVVAAAHYKIRYVIVLLELGAPVDVEAFRSVGITALFMSVQNLRKTTHGDHRRGGHYYDSDGPEEQPIHQAALAIACILVHWGADVNTRDSNGRTALHMASIHLDSKMVQLLMEAGADTTLVTNTTRETAENMIDAMYIEEGDCQDNDEHEMYSIENLFKMAKRNQLHKLAWKFEFKTTRLILQKLYMLDEDLSQMLDDFGHTDFDRLISGIE